MTPEQVAANAAIGNTVTQIFHILIIAFEAVLGYVMLRYRNENKRQQEQIDACRITLAALDEKLTEANEKLEKALRGDNTPD